MLLAYGLFVQGDLEGHYDNTRMILSKQKLVLWKWRAFDWQYLLVKILDI